MKNIYTKFDNGEFAYAPIFVGALKKVIPFRGKILKIIIEINRIDNQDQVLESCIFEETGELYSNVFATYEECSKFIEQNPEVAEGSPVSPVLSKVAKVEVETEASGPTCKRCRLGIMVDGVCDYCKFGFVPEPGMPRGE